MDVAATWRQPKETEEMEGPRNGRLDRASESPTAGPQAERRIFLGDEALSI